MLLFGNKHTDMLFECESDFHFTFWLSLISMCTNLYPVNKFYVVLVRYFDCELSCAWENSKHFIPRMLVKYPNKLYVILWPIRIPKQNEHLYNLYRTLITKLNAKLTSNKLITCFVLLVEANNFINDFNCIRSTNRVTLKR